MQTRRRTARAALGVLASVALLAGCASDPVGVRHSHASHAPTAIAAPPTHASSSARTSSSARPPAAPASSTPATSTPPAHVAQLPHGGTRILGSRRVVADYGAPGGGALGVLGKGSPEDAARRVERHADGFAKYGPVQPAMELIATVARDSAGPDHTYSTPVPDAQLAQYLGVAHEHHMLLLLDLQPGRASFLDQAKHLEHFLVDPSVGLGLDSEWKVGHGQRPGNGRIGSSSAADVNAVGAYVSVLVRTHHLPDKLMVVHEFTQSMLPDRAKIKTYAGVESVFHADGFGSPTVKRNVYRSLHFPGGRFGSGFKLFLTQDSRLMTPREVMALSPRPDVVTYQ